MIRLLKLLCVLVPTLLLLPVAGQAEVYRGSYTVNDALGMGVPVFRMYTRWDDPNDGHHGECQGGTFQGAMGEGGSDWAGPFLLDTTQDWGGCEQQFMIVDPPNGPSLRDSMHDLRIYVEFGPMPGTPAGFCDNYGQPSRREIPIYASTTGGPWTTKYRINTDFGSPNGCYQRFIVEGRPDIGLDIKFYATQGGDWGQCGNGLGPNMWHTASLGKPVELRLGTDDRPGGCYQAFRLRWLTGPAQDGPTQPFIETSNYDVHAIDVANKGVPVLSVLVSYYEAGGDARGAGQCPPSLVRRGIQSDGNDIAGMGPFRIDTDDRFGGCQMSFLIRDAVGGPSLVGLRVFLNFGPIDSGPENRVPNTCGNSGTHEIPILAYGEFGGGAFFDPIFINTDSRATKCRLQFSVEGRRDIGFDFQFYPEPGGDPAQCLNATGEGQWRTATVGHPDGFIIKTDNRPGGCMMAFRLRNLAATSTPGTLSKPTSATSSGQFTSPSNGAQVQGTVPLEVKAPAPTGIASVQMAIDGNISFCKIELHAPYTCSWDSRKVPNGSHVLSAIIKDKADNSITIPPVTVMVQNQAGAMPVSGTAAGPLAGHFSAPRNGAPVQGVVPLEVKATAAAGIASVQMAIDGNTTFCKIEMHAPYTCNWDSHKVLNGSHVLTAVVRDKANKTVLVPQVTVVVKN